MRDDPGPRGNACRWMSTAVQRFETRLHRITALVARWSRAGARLTCRLQSNPDLAPWHKPHIVNNTHLERESGKIVRLVLTIVKKLRADFLLRRLTRVDSSSGTPESEKKLAADLAT
jgi:hypothetical protein